jgi:hypothetical protein
MTGGVNNPLQHFTPLLQQPSPLTRRDRGSRFKVQETIDKAFSDGRSHRKQVRFNGESLSGRLRGLAPRAGTVAVDDQHRIPWESCSNDSAFG